MSSQNPLPYTLTEILAPGYGELSYSKRNPAAVDPAEFKESITALSKVHVLEIFGLGALAMYTVAYWPQIKDTIDQVVNRLF
jgi:hypothetical protein